jgi:hypothetical protein
MFLLSFDSEQNTMLNSSSLEFVNQLAELEMQQ